MNHKKVKKRRLTLGVLAGGGHIYNQRVWNGIVEVAQEQDVNLIAYQGLPLHAHGNYYSQSNIIYDLVNDNNVDGLLIISGSVFNHVTVAEAEAFLSQYISLPMISIGTMLPTIPSVMIDNHSGLYDLVTHLIVGHGLRRIAFISGPEHSMEAQIRHRAYTDALIQNGLSVDAKLVVPGEFVFQSGLEAIDLLVDQRQVQFDAIVAANDDMALGAMEGLRVRSIKVPGDVRVVGFDNIPQGEYSAPPLTTVQQSMLGLGRQAAANLLTYFNNEELPLLTQIPTIPVIRQSCGCLSPQVERAWVNKTMPTHLQETIVYEAIPRLAICEAMAQAFPADEPNLSAPAAQMLDTFLTALVQETPEIFLAEWSQVLRQAMFAQQNLFYWQEVLSILRRELMPFVMGTAVFHLADNLWHQARVLLTEIIQQASMRRETAERRHTILLREINETLLMVVDMQNLLEWLTNLLPQIGIKSCFLNLYEASLPDEQIKQVPEWLRLILAYDENGRLTLPIEGQRFPSTHLTPLNVSPAHERYDMHVIPLYMRETQLGYGLFEMDYPDINIFNLLRDQISGAIHRALLIRQIQQAKEGLEQRVKERTRELEIQNAELERFTYTVSHDLKSPLITIQGFLGFLEKDALAGDVERLRGDIARISGAATQMRVLLDELLELSRIGRLVNPPEPVSFADLIQEAVKLVSGQITAGGVQVIVASDLPIVYGDRHRLIEVMQNLLDNAVKFMGQQPKPRIEIGAESNEVGVLCYVRDNGIGIRPQYHEKVFDLFDRLDLSIEGTGIGLALVKRIIEVHNGRIWVESEGKGKGATFYFTLPAEMEQDS